MQLNQVTLPTVDLPRAVDFYSRLGLKQIVATEHYARFELPDGDATLSLHVVEKSEPSQAIIYFECEQLDQRVKELIVAGIEFDTPPQDQRWLWREARLRDPDGNRLCLYHAGKNRRHPPWRIGSD
ncbi:MAG: VOC family protein [Gammaproteobacteria bacterium]|nr:VOC family protein [Gammaproteobacteria bacterium]NNF60161.1 VOC family protein [Gammaproteobacteria bacterium]NNM21574.1 VOC family protein [Gammaproteobacteria bacterium]